MLVDVSQRPRERLCLASPAFLFLVASVSPALAAISVEGIADKKVYKDNVSFTIRAEVGFDYRATLNGEPIATDVSITVSEPEYHELEVSRRERSSGIRESRLIRFIVRAGDRGNTEWGLPRWTPYPTIDSAAEEFVGARLQIVAPAAYPMGLEIPVIARVEDASGNRVGVNGRITAAGFEEQPLRLLRGVGSVLLPPATGPDVVSYVAQVHSLQTTNQIVIEDPINWHRLSGHLTGTVNWGPDARVRITDALTIAADATLSIGSGSVIVIDRGVEIVVDGGVVVNGTLKRPVVFTCRDRDTPWGGFLFETPSSQGEFTGAILTGSGADPSWFSHNPGHGGSHRKNQCLFYLSNGASVTLTDCWIVDNHGQAGHGEKALLTMTRCLVQRCVTAGQYNGGAVVADDCAFIEFPSENALFDDADNDAFYLTSGDHSLTNCLIGWTLDDGIDAGGDAAGTVTIDRCWFESSYHEALAWSGAKICTIIDTVTINCGQGIECGYGAPDVNAVHCLSTTNAVGARFGDNYDWTYDGFLTVSDSLLLFNTRDVWGRAWDDWMVHGSQMVIWDNYLSVLDAAHPANSIWQSLNAPDRSQLLASFLPSPAGTVGIGLAVLDDTLDRAALPQGIPVRLSTFTTSEVSVNYAIRAENRRLGGGILHFLPGETVKHIRSELMPTEDVSPIRIALHNPINAEFTGTRQATCLRTSHKIER